MFSLPKDVLELIKQYAYPIMTRLDWKTCKRAESSRIKMSNRALLLWFKWIIGPGFHPVFEEIKSWTFYGRRHLIQESRKRKWTKIPLTDFTEDDKEWYEKKYIIHAVDDRMIHATWPMECHMASVSLIV